MFLLSDTLAFQDFPKHIVVNRVFCVNFYRTFAAEGVTFSKIELIALRCVLCKDVPISGSKKTAL